HATTPAPQPRGLRFRHRLGALLLFDAIHELTIEELSVLHHRRRTVFVQESVQLLTAGALRGGIEPALAHLLFKGFGISRAEPIVEPECEGFLETRGFHRRRGAWFAVSFERKKAGTLRSQAGSPPDRRSPGIRAHRSPARRSPRGAQGYTAGWLQQFGRVFLCLPAVLPARSPLAAWSRLRAQCRPAQRSHRTPSPLSLASGRHHPSSTSSVC